MIITTQRHIPPYWHSTDEDPRVFRRVDSILVLEEKSHCKFIPNIYDIPDKVNINMVDINDTYLPWKQFAAQHHIYIWAFINDLIFGTNAECIILPEAQNCRISGV